MVKGRFNKVVCDSKNKKYDFLLHTFCVDAAPPRDKTFSSYKKYITLHIIIISFFGYSTLSLLSKDTVQDSQRERERERERERFFSTFFHKRNFHISLCSERSSKTCSTS